MLGIFWVMVVIGVLGIVTISTPEHHAQNRKAEGSPIAQQAASENREAKEEGQTSRWAKYKKEIEDNEKVITAVSTVFIAAFTVVLAFATGFLYVATKKLVEGADQTAEKQLRAYVGLQSMEMTIYPFAQGGFVIFPHTEARNFGQTPAYGLTVRTNTTVDIPTAIPFDDSQGTAKSAGAMTAFKDVGFQINQTKIITAEDAQAIRDQKKIVFFWGSIKYRDAFNKDHVFKFRLISNALLVGSNNVWSLVAHPIGFEDEDQPKPKASASANRIALSMASTLAPCGASTDQPEGEGKGRSL
jgi:hypothetical protein